MACSPPTLPDGVGWDAALVSTSASGMTISWPEPQTSLSSVPLVAGCEITGYILYMSRDSGVTYAEIDTASVRGKPNLHEHAVASTNFDVAGGTDLGSTFLFRIVAENVAGTLAASTLEVVLADVPATPTVGPSHTVGATSDVVILFGITAVDGTVPALTGGSKILSYSLEVDDGAGGSFVALYGVTAPSLSISHSLSIANMRGKVHRARFRALNAVGWSSYSPITYTRAARVPAAPSTAPQYVSATSTTMNVILTLSEDNGGSVITSHELWVDDGALGSF